jgi:hypothetical protein
MKEYKPPFATPAGGMSDETVRTVATDSDADDSPPIRFFMAYRGKSMKPVFRDGDVLEVCRGGTPTCGDVVVAVPQGAGERVVHRVCRVKNGLVFTRGDNRVGRDPWTLSPGQIRGVVVAAWRGSRRRRVLNGAAGRALSAGIAALRVAAVPAGAVLRPLHRLLVVSGAVRRLLPDCLKPRLVEFCSPAGVRRRLVWRGMLAGWQDTESLGWHYVFPFSLLVDPGSMADSENPPAIQPLRSPGSCEPSAVTEARARDPETAFAMLACAAGLNPGLSDSLRRHAGSQDWGRVFRLAAGHCLWGLLFRGLREHAWDLLPEQTAVQLRTEALRSRARNMQLVLETASVCRTLRSAGARHAAIKGPVLSKHAYGDSGLRVSWDIDLLVHSRDVGRSVAALEAEGYAVDFDLPRAFLPRQIRNMREVTLVHPDRAFRVELLTHVAPSFLSGSLDRDPVWGRIVEEDIDGHRLPAVSAEDHFLLCCLHAAKHEWERLLWIMDAAGFMMRKDGLDWDYVVERAESTGQLRRSLITAILACRIAGAPLSGALAGRLNSDPVAGNLARRILNGYTWSAPAVRAPSMQLACMERRRDRMRAILMQTFAPSYSDWKWTSLPRGLRFLYFLVRPVRLWLRTVRGISRFVPGRSATGRAGCSVRRP